MIPEKDNDTPVSEKKKETDDWVSSGKGKDVCDWCNKVKDVSYFVSGDCLAIYCKECLPKVQRDYCVLEENVKPCDLRPEVVAFANLMEERLRANDHKGGWKGENPRWLLSRLHDEVGELHDLIATTTDMDPAVLRQRVAKEAADIANFALFICDVMGALDANEDVL